MQYWTMTLLYTIFFKGNRVQKFRFLIKSDKSIVNLSLKFSLLSSSESVNAVGFDPSQMILHYTSNHTCKCIGKNPENISRCLRLPEPCQFYNHYIGEEIKMHLIQHEINIILPRISKDTYHPKIQKCLEYTRNMKYIYKISQKNNGFLTSKSITKKNKYM